MSNIYHVLLTAVTVYFGYYRDLYHVLIGGICTMNQHEIRYTVRERA